MSDIVYECIYIIDLVIFRFFIRDWNFYISNVSCRKCCNMVRIVLDNLSTIAWFVIREYFNENEGCKNFEEK